ncbi:hypothetical protein AMELA_G00166260 [Ameiurus melas]|uniref:Uncharacterized protein n=1 Tax=Ameiurus melas TaxID=219545 RepID=A0A7J6ABS3_AMEME|nr:hypothetical protein AMELA_G00166260 [Ameiurus melas]
MAFHTHWSLPFGCNTTENDLGGESARLLLTYRAYSVLFKTTAGSREGIVGRDVQFLGVCFPLGQVPVQGSE